VLWRAASLAVVAVALTFASPAAAQDPALPPYDYSQFDTLLNTLGNPYRGGGDSKPAEKRKAAPKRPTADQRAALRFKPVPEITQGIYQKVADETGWPLDHVASQFDPAKATLRTALVDGAGWRAEDLGDVAAFGLVQAYIRVNRAEDANLPDRGLEWMRRAVRDDLALQRPVRRLSDARQQEIAESLEIRVIFLISDVATAQLAGDAAAEADARAAFRTWAKETYGVDLAKLKLTRRGLVKRV
jgi:uncharacterized protein DUF6683